ncbi:MAG TPA: glycosyltransferase family 39 protein [Nevskiaceae bacterium]|nr:glycosyltransferase family 39 protein [Nevskiaceae bacterium]
MRKLLVVILLLIFLALNIFSALRESLTYDEPVHLKAGIEEWQTKIFSLDANNPPLIREITALPMLFGAQKLISSPYPAHQYLPSRLMITFLGLILAVVVFKYIEKHFGWKPALFSLILFVFEPNVLAYSHYVTLDLGTVLFFFLAYLSFLRFLDKPDFKNGLTWSLFFGLAMASKVTIIPALCLSFLVMVVIKRKSLNQFFWKKAFLGIIFSLLVVWTTYFFTFSPVIAERKDPNRLSEKILVFAEKKSYQFLKNFIYFGKGKPVPLGYFLTTIKNGLVYNLQPHRTEFLGQFYPDNRFYFLPTIIALKTPLPLLILFFVGIFLACKKREKIILSMIMPIFFLVFFFSFGHIYPRLRYALAIYPFIIIVASFGAGVLLKKRLGQMILGLILLWYVVGTLSVLPHFISFANEIAGLKDKRLFLFSDSNYDWGQSLFDLKEYVGEENIAILYLSYFGQDNPNEYGFVADRPYGVKLEERCPFYSVVLKDEGKKVLAISLSNYYYCDYFQQDKFAKKKVSQVVGDSILIFNSQ